MFRYEEASPDMLNAVWDKNIAEHTGDEQWKHWKEEYISYNSNGSAKTFTVSYDGSPVGEETLLFSPQCSAVRGRLELANGTDTVNINALRIDKRFGVKDTFQSLSKSWRSMRSTEVFGTSPSELRRGKHETCRYIFIGDIIVL